MHLKLLQGLGATTAHRSKLISPPGMVQEGTTCGQTACVCFLKPGQAESGEGTALSLQSMACATPGDCTIDINPNGCLCWSTDGLTTRAAQPAEPQAS